MARVKHPQQESRHTRKTVFETAFPIWTPADIRRFPLFLTRFDFFTRFDSFHLLTHRRRRITTSESRNAAASYESYEKEQESQRPIEQASTFA